MDTCTNENESVSIQIKSISQSEKSVFLFNHSDSDIYIPEKEICSLKISDLGFSTNVNVYAEGYQMLQQIYTKLCDLSETSKSMDKDHYKFSQTPGYYTAYNFIYLEENNRCVLIGASSCERFSTKILINQSEIKLVQTLENIRIPKNSTIRLESYSVIECKNRNDCLLQFSEQLNHHHPRLPFHEIPDGWCSWYCYGALVTEGAIRKNLKVAKRELPKLKYIQIDDGYQPHMGDWLLQTKKFRSRMKDICLNIRA